MAIVPTVRTASGSNADSTSYTTASITPTANDPILLLVTSGTAAAADPNNCVATAAGNGLTWVEVITKLNIVQNRRITAFRAAGVAPTSGIITISFGAQTQTFCQWSVVQFDGADEGGTNGSAAIVQANSAEPPLGAPATTLSVSLNAFADAVNNVAFGAFFHQAAEATTPGGSFQELSDTWLDTPNSALETEWLPGEP